MKKNRAVKKISDAFIEKMILNTFKVDFDNKECLIKIFLLDINKF